jgi:hypothetical protein
LGVARRLLYRGHHHKGSPMSALKPIDSLALDTVTGGGTVRSHGSGSSSGGSGRVGGTGNILLEQLSSLADGIKDITNKTSGFNSNQFLLLALLFSAQRQNGVVLYRGW